VSFHLLELITNILAKIKDKIEYLFLKIYPCGSMAEARKMRIGPTTVKVAEK